MRPHVPGQETRGGDKVDWARAQPGEPLPERGETFPEPDSEELPPGLGSWEDDDGNTYGYEDPDGYPGPDAYSDPDGEDGGQ